MHLPKGSAGLHIGEHTLQISHPTSQFLHIPKSLVDLFQPFTNQLKRFSQASFQRGLEFLIHSGAHLLQLLCIVLAHLIQLALQSRPQLLKCDILSIPQFPQYSSQRLT